MQNIPLELLTEISEYLEEFDSESEERWPVQTPASKTNILNFRSVSQGFRHASWAAFGRIIGQQAINTDNLDAIVQHPRLRSWIKTMTFGCQEGHGNLCSTTSAIKRALTALPHLSSIRIRPSPGRQHHYSQWGVTIVRTTAPSKQVCQWCSLQHLSTILSNVPLPIVEFSFSSLCDMAPMPHTPLLRITAPNLRTLKLTLLEPALIGDGEYADPKQTESALALVQFLETTKHLKTLDLAFKYSNTINFRSGILANLARSTPCYSLQHLCLDNALISQDDLSKLLAHHTLTLKRLILITPWLRPGSWNGVLRELREESTARGKPLALDYFEIWKPSQGALSFHENHKWIDGKLLAALVKDNTHSRTKLVPFKGETDEESGYPFYYNGGESWEHCGWRMGPR